MFPPDPLSVDRELRAGALRWRRWRRALRRGVFVEEPFGGTERFGKTLFDWATELPEDLPLRGPLRRWIYRLAEQRIDGPWLAREAVLLRGALHAVREPVEGQFSLAHMRRAALRGPFGDLWHAAFSRAARELASHRLGLWERRQEIARRMGLQSPDELELPAGDVYGVADALLRGTAEVVAEQVEPGWSAYVESGLARSAASGWPARLAPDTLVDLLGERDWFRGIELEAGPLPERLAPASFLRAMARVGAAWHAALVPRDRPFVLSQDPYGLEAFASGALFVRVATSEPFLRRQLGLGRDAARQHGRELRLSVGQGVRLLSVRCLGRRAVLGGRRHLAEQGGELLFRLLRQELDPLLLCAFTRLRVDDGARLGGWLLAARRFEQLVEAYDEDWYRSPRAIEQLREEAKAPLLGAAPALDEGRVAAERWLLS